MVEKTEIKSGVLSEERRTFIKRSGALMAMSLMGLSFFTACSNEDDPAPVNGNDDDYGNGDGNGNGQGTGIVVDGNTITIDLDIQDGLKTTGAWLLIVEAQVLVVNVGNNAFSALTSVCTHQGCSTSWSFSNSTFTCGCHGSRFSTSGAVQGGPAQLPLQQFGTSVDANILTIQK